ncbi:Aspartate aminotransferase, cytoplasmic [Araneus ventricosus]|uniref:aspartate transaminase n=1 Tax=Araneus ventricosus TaxID=182803 RepID=A0A4Y2JEW4_ARAVE|nr:Aspartate aminotransferase, cytoplasmic [Araneus ventricosus]
MSRFTRVESASAIEVFAMRKAFEEDTFPHKVDLGIGAYRTDEGQPWVLPVVRKIEKAIAEDDSLNHEYCDILGMESFRNAASRILLGEDNPVFKEGKIMSAQALSGTGALRLGAVFLTRCLKLKDCYISSPAFPNHPVIFRAAGFKNCHTYRYWNAAEKNLDFTGMNEDLEGFQQSSVELYRSFQNEDLSRSEVPPVVSCTLGHTVKSWHWQKTRK